MIWRILRWSDAEFWLPCSTRLRRKQTIHDEEISVCIIIMNMPAEWSKFSGEKCRICFEGAFLPVQSEGQRKYQKTHLK